MYNDQVNLGTDVVLDATLVTFMTGLGNGTSRNLDIAGNVVFNGTVGSGVGLASLEVTGTTIINGISITTTGLQSYNGAVTLGIASALTTTNNDILLGSSLNGGHSLTFTAGSGNLSFIGPVGNLQPLGVITITSAAAVNFTDTISAASFSQNAGSVSTSFNGTQTYTGNFAFTGTALNLNNNLSVGGSITITNAGLFTKNTTGVISSTLAFVQNGTGSSSIGANLTTGSANISFLRAVQLTNTVQFSTGVGTAGNITLSNTVAGDSAATRALTLEAGIGTILVSGVIGGSQSLATLSLSAEAGITLNGIGSGAPGVSGTVTAISSGFITLNSADYISTETQTWSSGTGVRYRGSNPGPWSWSAGGPGIQLETSDLFIDHTGADLSIASNISARNIYFYRGGLSLAGVELSTTLDLAIFGSAYNPIDPDRIESHPANIFHRYPAAATPLAYYPGGGTYNAGTASFSVAPAASFISLDGATISVSGNFYVNGTDMLGTMPWNLAVPNNATVTPPNGNPAAFSWGTPYAVALNTTVSNSVATVGWVNAAARLPAGPGPYTEHNNGVQDNGGTTNWQFLRPQIRVASTVYDDVIKISFEDNDGNPMQIQNLNGEIADAVAQMAVDNTNGSIWYNGGSLKFSAAYATAEDTVPLGNGNVDTFYIRTTSTRWNTDATGSSSGAALSTDRGRSGEAPVHRTIIPDLTMLKGLLFAADGKTASVNYGTNSYAVYNATLDECRPVLIGLELGQATHTPNNPAPPAWDAHNYIQLRWSEPVRTGDMDQVAVNEKSAAVFSTSPEEWGGALSGSTLAGYAAFQTADFDLGARSNAEAPDDDGLLSSQVNGLYRGGPNAYGDHGMYVSVAGWSYLSGGIRFWPGYFVSTPVVPAGTVGVPLNTGLLDFAGNVIEHSLNPMDAGYYEKVVVEVQGTAWDIMAPEIALDLLGDPFFDVVPLATFNEIDKFELRFSKAVRDSSFYYAKSAPAGMTTGLPGFTFRDEDRETAFRFGATGFDTNVTSPAFGGPVNISNDALVTMAPVTINPLWTPTSQMSFRYTHLEGLVTDLAGNLLPSYVPSFFGEVFLCVERLPPKIRFTMANAGTNDLYLQFTEPVWKGILNDPAGRLFDPGDFILLDAPSASIDEVVVITPALDELGALQPVTEVLLRFTDPITTQFSLEAKLALSSAIIDRAATSAQDSVIRRAVDLATGVVNVLGASDGVHLGNAVATQDDLGTGSLGLLRAFDGSGRLYDRDTTIFTSLDLSGGANPLLPLQMYFDIGEPATGIMTVPITGREDQPGLFWLPSYFSGFNLDGNTESRVLSPFLVGVGGVSRNFLVPAADPEIVPGARVNFLFRYGDLWLARSSSSTDPLQFDLWRYRIEDIVRQRGGVTILNNVIDSIKKERTALQVELADAGQVSVMVFTLDGDVVRTLHRGRLAAGTYSMTWDGSNSAGRPVARGIYFIRVVAPGIDEIRKVMVIKN